MSDFEDEDDFNEGDLPFIIDEDEDEGGEDFPEIQMKFDKDGFPMSPPPMDINKSGELVAAKRQKRQLHDVVEEEKIEKIGLSLMSESTIAKSRGIDLFLSNFKMVETEIFSSHKTKIPLPEASLLKSLLKESKFSSEDWIEYIKKSINVEELAVEIFNTLTRGEE